MRIGPGTGTVSVIDDFPIPGLQDLPGFLTPRAAWLLDRLARHQTGVGVHGDIAEIGVFYGRSALVLGAALADGERLIACDRFDVGAGDVPGWAFAADAGPEETLREWWGRCIGDPERLVVRRGDSAGLSARDLGAPARLVHVDGGHAYDAVIDDLTVADRALAPGGAVVVDDVLLAEWPDVTVALVDHLRSLDGTTVPVLVAEHKAVLCRREDRAAYREWALRTAGELFAGAGDLVAERGFAGESVVVASRLRG
ncbi:MAG: class I SAM-dependent methyltransferase [Thermoleophilia bacterium]